MRSADSFSGCSAEEIRIVFAPHKTAGVLINRVIDIYISQIRHGQQTGYIGIIHQDVVAESVHLECINRSILGMGIDGMFLQSLFNLIGQTDALRRQLLIMVDFFQDLGCFPQGRNGKEIRRYQEGKSRCVI